MAGTRSIFSQALNRKISILDLQPAYRQNQDVSEFVRQTVALAFVPRRFIRLAWQAIKVTAPAIDKMDEFVAYFEETQFYIVLVTFCMSRRNGTKQ